jgi:RND family efflux transporter MFP subunit
VQRWPRSLSSVACKKEAPPIAYEAVPVERRDIVVSAQASGAIQPDTTVEVKSKASGEILQLSAETGQVVQRGAPLVRIDPRNARNALAQAQADLDVAKAKLTNAASQKQRADALYKSQSITEQEHEQALLDYADAKSQVVRSQVSVDNARIQLEDTDVRAPITGTILEKDVERGTVIASATSNVSGGTTLMKMANLNQVQVRALVDETDIGKLQAGQPASITVDAYPQHPFNGTVLKIEPQAQTEQNVTMFPVLIRIDNKEGAAAARDESRGGGSRGPARRCACRCPMLPSEPSETWLPPRRCSVSLLMTSRNNWHPLGLVCRETLPPGETLWQGATPRNTQLLAPAQPLRAERMGRPIPHAAVSAAAAGGDRHRASAPSTSSS